ncbi:MAG: sigma-54-dependent Fis family transcriptional regulator [Deltaproteobacteria bacterium]|nr:sigma-54-dependent Fis family transcriptional regulator [Deltaproteobacteria bacterium]
MYRYKVLIVDDDKLLQNALNNILSERYDVIIAGSGEEAVRLLQKHSFDLVLLDVRLPGIDGIETLHLIKKLELDDDPLVIMMTAYEDIKTVIVSMKMGAEDYLIKPLDIDELELIIEKALDKLKLKKEVDQLRKQYLSEFNIDSIVGKSKGIKMALELAKKVAKSYDTTVLIEGETGVGKELIARAIHYRSVVRIGQPFVSINCGSINKDLIESELFGYAKGTFTGQLQEGKKGKIELAHGGSLFLDEVSELLPSSQVKLLRFLEDKEFYPVGGTEKKKVDVRVVAATNKNLEQAIAENSFRKDLYYRLNVVKISLPPLRERKEDIIPLSLFFMNAFNQQFGKIFQRISKDAENIFVNYRWPGNIRELKNAVERIVLLEDDDVIQKGHLNFLMEKGDGSSSKDAVSLAIPPSGLDLEGLNRQLIIQALQLTGGNKTKAARLLGISRATLIYRIDKYLIDR